MMRHPRWLGGVLVALSVAGCAAEDDRPRESLGESQASEIQAPLAQAVCQVVVEGAGARDIELDYLPRVLACSKQEGGPEALKALAIAARSVAYYEVLAQGREPGVVCQGKGCQTYLCDLSPEPRHHEAVKATAGQYLSYAGLLTYGAYVQGASVDASCRSGSAAHEDSLVTHNEGKSGGDVAWSEQIWHPREPGIFGQNRGCMSLLGVSCLATQGRTAEEILRFYYGQDIGLTTAPAGCSPLPPPGPPCLVDEDCSGGQPARGVVCQEGRCVDGCRTPADCVTGSCVVPAQGSVGACQQPMPPLGSSCQSDAQCQAGHLGTGRVCGSSSKHCLLGCHQDEDCGQGTCDKSDGSHWRCVHRQLLGEACEDDVQCHGGVPGTKRVCHQGQCADRCHGDFDCGPQERCRQGSGACELSLASSAPAPSADTCLLSYPSITLQGIPTPAQVRQQYAVHKCEDLTPPCMLDVTHLVDAATGAEVSFSHLELAPGVTLRELTLTSIASSPFVHVDPSVVVALQRTRQALGPGGVSVLEGYRSPLRQEQICRERCGQATCQGDLPCQSCSIHMTGLALDLEPSGTLCELAQPACEEGRFHRFVQESSGQGAEHLHVDMGPAAVCTLSALPTSCPVDVCARASGDGTFCARQLGGSEDSLLTCQEGKTTSSQACTAGCEPAASGASDACRPEPLPAGIPASTLKFGFPLGDRTTYPAGGAPWTITQVMGHYYKTYNGIHLGEDVAGGAEMAGSPVYAIADGTVVISVARPSNSYKQVVVIRHELGDGRRVCSAYGHLESRIVEKDQVVKRGDQIASVLHWGAKTHLHYTVIDEAFCNAIIQAKGGNFCGYDGQQKQADGVEEMDPGTAPNVHQAHGVNDNCHTEGFTVYNPSQFIQAHHF